MEPAPQMRKPGVPRARRADVPELAFTGMKRDQLLESGLTSPLLSHVQRRFPTLHEFRGNHGKGDAHSPSQLTTMADHTVSRQGWPTRPRKHSGGSFRHEVLYLSLIHI